MSYKYRARASNRREVRNATYRHKAFDFLAPINCGRVVQTQSLCVYIILNQEEMEEAGNKKVMVAIDESECSHYALLWTLENLKDTIAKSELIIYTTLPIAEFSYIYASTLGTPHPDLIKSVQEHQKKVGEALLEKAKSICADHGIAAVTISEVGDPKEAICEAVEKLNIHILVLGSHGKGALKRAFLGSVSNYCVHNANCTVLVVRKPV